MPPAKTPEGMFEYGGRIRGYQSCLDIGTGRGLRGMALASVTAARLRYGVVLRRRGLAPAFVADQPRPRSRQVPRTGRATNPLLIHLAREGWTTLVFIRRSPGSGRHHEGAR